MTSSFTMPGGITVAFYRAVPLKNAAPLNPSLAKKIPTEWQLVESAQLEGATLTPPARAADYAGQIVAVAVPRTTSPA